MGRGARRRRWQPLARSLDRGGVSGADWDGRPEL